MRVGLTFQQQQQLLLPGVPPLPFCATAPEPQLPAFASPCVQPKTVWCKDQERPDKQHGR